MRRRLFSVLTFLLLLSSPVFAQTHPCDEPQQAPGQHVRAGVSFTIGWCHNGKDTNGNVTAVTAWMTSKNGSAGVAVSPAVSPTANAAGLFFYTIVMTETTPGAVNLEVWAVNVTGDSAKGSHSYIVDPALTVPTGPTGLRVVPNIS